MNPIEPSWGSRRFTYSKTQVEHCYSALDNNWWDLITAFEVVWTDERAFLNEPRENADFVLRLLRTICAWKEIEGRSPERIWKAMRDKIKTDEALVASLNLP